jgi:hypothetical protein
MFHQTDPVSALYLALDGMVSLERLRVFDLRGTRYAPSGERIHA